MSKKQPAPGALRSVPTGWRNVLLICKKCSKKLDGGYGDDGATSLRKAVRSALRESGLRGQLGLIEVPCFGVCPKRAVTVAHGGDPSELLVVPAGAKLQPLLVRAMSANRRTGGQG